MTEDLYALQLYTDDDLEKYEELEKQFTFSNHENISNDMSYLADKETRRNLFKEIFIGVEFDD